MRVLGWVRAGDGKIDLAEWRAGCNAGLLQIPASADSSKPAQATHTRVERPPTAPADEMTPVNDY